MLCLNKPGTEPIESSRFTAVAAYLAVLAPALLCGPWIASPSRGITAILAAVVVGWAYLAAPLDRWLGEHPRHRTALCLGWSAMVAVMVFGPNLGARWWIIDDHEIFAAVGPQKSMSLADWATQLRDHTEFGSPGKKAVRYRPAYFLLRLTECLFWGKNPATWYAVRLAILAASVAMMWELFWQRLGSLNASLLLLALLTYPFWADVWCRLGPAEAYAVFGTAMYLAGIAAVYSTVLPERPAKPSQPVLPWLQMTLGGLVAIGSKENFLVLLPATWIFGLWLWRRRQLGPVGLICVAVLTARDCSWRR